MSVPRFTYWVPTAAECAPVIDCDDCGNPLDPRSRAEGHWTCEGCRTAAEWREYDAAVDA